MQSLNAHNSHVTQFFVIFLEWAFPFCVWTFATLLAENIKASSSSSESVDPQEIVIIAVSGLFMLFAYIMLMTHLHVVLTNQTTVESLEAREIKSRENWVLAELFPWWAYRCARFLLPCWRSFD